MKNLGLNNGKAQKVILLVLATCVVVGLVSSTAIKLASSTYFLQSLRNKNNTQTVTPDGGDNVTVNNQTPAPVPTQPATQAATQAATQGATQATTQAATQATTHAATQATTQAATQATTQAATQAATQTPETTESAASIKQKKTIVAKYNDLVNPVKAHKVKDGKIIYDGKITCTKVAYRSLSSDGLGMALKNVESAYPQYFISKDEAKEAPVLITSDNVGKEFLINHRYYAGMLSNADVKSAVESATNVKLEDGTRKITIVLKDEVDPANTATDSDTAASYTASMFPVLSINKIIKSVNATVGSNFDKVSSGSVTYSGCTVELIYNPKTNHIISIKQSVNYSGELKGDNFLSGILTNKGSVSETYEYTDFSYSK